MKKKCLFLIGMYAIFLLFNSCKKGENDPAISFRSRKARVAGEWRLSEGSVRINTVGSATQNINYKMRGSNIEQNWSYTGASVIYFWKGNYELNLNIDKGGTFTLKETVGSDKIECTGSWTFNDKSSDKKSKEYLQMSISKISVGNTYSTLFNHGQNSFTYQITELRHKRMVLHVGTSTYKNTQNGAQQNWSGKYVLVSD